MQGRVQQKGKQSFHVSIGNSVSLLSSDACSHHSFSSSNSNVVKHVVRCWGIGAIKRSHLIGTIIIVWAMGSVRSIKIIELRSGVLRTIRYQHMVHSFDEVRLEILIWVMDVRVRVFIFVVTSFFPAIMDLAMHCLVLSFRVWLVNLLSIPIPIFVSIRHVGIHKVPFGFVFPNDWWGYQTKVLQTGSYGSVVPTKVSSGASDFSINNDSVVSISFWFWHHLYFLSSSMRNDYKKL